MSRKKLSGFESGIPWYTEMRMPAKSIFFPTDHVTCNYCHYCRYEEGFKRYRCSETRELLVYPFEDIGRMCPLKPIVKKEKNHDDQD